MIAIIAAYDKHKVIGKNGKIPWNIEGEQKRFKHLTVGNAVIMGRRTYEEIGRPLLDRINIILSSGSYFDGCINVRSLDEAIRAAGDRDIYISGGSEIYKASLPFAEKLYITEIDAEFDGDTYFPDFDESKFTKIIESETNGTIPYRYVTYVRISQN